MAPKNYYVILGVARSETPAGIRAAYRDLAKKMHPDRTGGEGTAAFQDVVEAYEILSDPGKRKRHNHDLQRAEEFEAMESPRSYADIPRRRVPEEPISIFRRRQDIRPSFEALWDRFERNFTGKHIPKSEHLESLNFNLILTPEEFLTGIDLPVQIPTFRECPECRGAGQVWGFPCISCDCQGIIEEEENVTIRIPPMTRAGTIVEVPLRGLGIHNFYLRLHIYVE